MKHPISMMRGIPLGAIFRLISFFAIVSLSLLTIAGMLLFNAMSSETTTPATHNLPGPETPLAPSTNVRALPEATEVPVDTKGTTHVPPGEWATPLLLAFLTLVLLGMPLIAWCDQKFIQPLSKGIEDLLQEVSENCHRKPSYSSQLETRELKQLEFIVECLIERNAQQENTRRVLNREIIIDPLTQLFNRKGFQILSKRIIGMLERVRAPVSVVMIDLDHFKHINDTYGHAVGDRVLTAVAKCMRRLNRYGDIFSRYGGEEFLLLSVNCDAAGAQVHAERIREAIAEIEICPSPTLTLRVTASLGVTTFEADKTLIEDAIQHADAMMYEAKRSGRNRVCVDPLLPPCPMLTINAWNSRHDIGETQAL